MVAVSPNLDLAGVAPADGLPARRPLRPTVHLVPRQDCTFRRIRLLNDSSAAERAARLKARMEGGGTAEVVIVRDADGLGAGLWMFQRVSDTRRHLPETLARSPGRDEIRLIRCLRGVEGQVWAGGDLVASRWWASEPDTASWQSFLYSVPPDVEIASAARPALTTVPLAPRVPLLSLQREDLRRTLSPGRLALAGTALALGVMLFDAGRLVRTEAQGRALQADIEVLSDTVAQNRALRGAAIENLAYAERLDSVANDASPLLVMRALTSVLEGEDVRLRSFRMGMEGVELRLLGTLGMGEPELVAAMEATGLVEQVRIVSRSERGIIIAAVPVA